MIRTDEKFIVSILNHSGDTFVISCEKEKEAKRHYRASINNALVYQCCISIQYKCRLGKYDKKGGVR